MLAIQPCIAGAGVIQNCNGCHITDANFTNGIHADQQRSGNVLYGTKSVADLQKPAVVVGIVNVTGRHGEVLCVNKLCQGADIQKLTQVCLRKCFLTRGCELLSGRSQLCLCRGKLCAGAGKAQSRLQLRLCQAGNGFFQTCQNIRDGV